ncbi:MAG: 50S ribosomal protein L11 methyltransferase [Thermodesulfobacteriota bacterium]|nr:50S ribosomal protein L11 methyltransferase [Thermodesulfobacteriota bacterium]
MKPDDKGPAGLSTGDRGKRGSGPPKDLYVYLFRGLLPKKEEGKLGEAFVGNWVEDGSSFLFFGSPADNIVGELLKLHPDLELVETHYFTYDQWQGGSLSPVRIDDFVIVPPWERMETVKGGIPIVLDPGVVFGNGLHPTTRACMRAMTYARRQQPFKSVLDLGTGTGVLSLAAALLGSKSVLAVDHNPLCVKTATRNVRLNGLRKTIRVVAGAVEDFVNEPADLVVANIQFDVTRDLTERRVFHTEDRVIISGLMRSQYREVKAGLRRRHFQILREWDHDMTWFTVLAVKG